MHDVKKLIHTLGQRELVRKKPVQLIVDVPLSIRSPHHHQLIHEFLPPVIRDSENQGLGTGVVADLFVQSEEIVVVYLSGDLVLIFRFTNEISARSNVRGLEHVVDLLEGLVDGVDWGAEIEGSVAFVTGQELTEYGGGDN